MPEFTEVRVKLEDKHVVPFIRFLEDSCPYQFGIAGLDTIKQMLRLPAPERAERAPEKPRKETPQHSYQKRKSLRIWKRVYDIIKEGNSSWKDTAILAGYENTPHTAMRIINTLKRKGYVKGDDGTYAVTSKEFNYGN